MARLEVVEVKPLGIHPARRHRDTREPRVRRRSGRRPSTSANGPTTSSANVASSRRGRRDARGRSRRRYRRRRPVAAPSRGCGRLRRGPTRANPCRRRRSGTGHRRARGSDPDERAQPTLVATEQHDPCPAAASARLAARPSPDVGPVTSGPSGPRAPSRGAVQRSSRPRTAGPIRLKLPTTEISRAASTRRAPSMVRLLLIRQTVEIPGYHTISPT